MNFLPAIKQIEIIAALVEGCSMLAVDRLNAVYRDAIMRLGARVGHGCATGHDAIMRDLQVTRIEMDEAWSYVGKKQARVKPEDGRDVDDQYVFIAMAGRWQGDHQLSRRQA